MTILTDLYAGSYNSVDSCIWNWKRSNNAKAIAAMAGVLDGARRMAVAEIGDSTTIGQSTSDIGAKSKSRPSQVAAMLANAGIPTNVQSVFGDSGCNSMAQLSDYDPTITVGTGWVSGSSYTSGGNLFNCLSPDTGIFSWTPVGNVDRFRLRHLTNTGAGIIEYSTDGTTWTTTNQNAAASLVTVNITVTRGTNTLRIRRNSGGTVYFCTLEAWDSTTPAIDICNMGWKGGTNYDWSKSTQPWHGLGTLTSFAPDLSIINLTLNSTDLNDVAGDNAGNFETNYKARSQAIIDNVKVTGDVWLCIGNQQNPSVRTHVNQQLVRKYVYDLAVTNDLPVLDYMTRIGSWGTAVSDGVMFDTSHPTTKGYSLLAQVEYAAFRRLL